MAAPRERAPQPVALPASAGLGPAARSRLGRDLAGVTSSVPTLAPFPGDPGVGSESWIPLLALRKRLEQRL